MRTTVDVPDDLYRQLKARAALQGLKVREVLIEYLEAGLKRGHAAGHRGKRSALPTIIRPSGKPIAALSRAKLAALDEAAESERHARPARR